MTAIIVTGSYLAGLWIGNSFIEPRLTFRQLVVVATVCSILVFVPFAGGILSLAAGTILIYRLSDISWGNAFVIMFLSRGIAVLVAIGFASYMSGKGQTICIY